MNRLCTICVRKGSKGVPGKNWKEILGRPLFEHSVMQAQASKLFDAVILSTDSEIVIDFAKNLKIDLIITRPPELATDESGKIPAIVHAVKEAEKLLNKNFEVLVDLDATSPLRNVDDIEGVIDLLETSNSLSVITGNRSHRSPYFNMVEIDQSGFVKICKSSDQSFLRRQDTPITYDMNASIYAWKKDAFLNDPKVFYDNTRLFEMPKERSFDIDNEFDFKIVEFLLSQKEI